MKQKKIFFLIISIVVIVLGFVFMGQQMSAQQTLSNSYDLEEGILNGEVIQDGTQIHNLSRLEKFYQNMNRKIDDSIVVVIYHSATQSELYELIYTQDQLKVYTDIKTDDLGRKEYKIKMYTGIKKILKNNQVIYKLVNEKGERQFLSYNLK
ncbi:MAG TPA: hypothetical protein DCY20_07045 [Firmicutes bacterium]|nr:hypothetical protein [Bacillota bacterium]